MTWFIDKIFGSRKKREAILGKREALVDETMVKSTKVQETNAVIQKHSIEIALKNQQLTEEIKTIVIEYEQTKRLFLKREIELKNLGRELEERSAKLRKEEIVMETRKSDLRRKEQEWDQKNKEIEKERKSIKEREIKSDSIKKEGETEKAKYEKLNAELSTEKEGLNDLEKELNLKLENAKKKSADADAIFEKAKVIDVEIKLKEEKFEEQRQAIESSLREKHEEVDRRLADLDNVKGIVDDVKFDDSEDGKSAKIVVKEAIRKAKAQLSELVEEFEALNEKYCSGTFKGFSTPITEIDKCFEELKGQFQQIRDYVNSSSSLPSSVNLWLERIEDNILKADTFKKSWEFSEAFRSIIYGLSACQNFELLITILSEWNSGGSADESNESPPDDFVDWYDVMSVDPLASAEEIHKQWKVLMKKYHPDKATNEEEREEFTSRSQNINAAHDVLMDEEKRKAFDEIRNKRKQNN